MLLLMGLILIVCCAFGGSQRCNGYYRRSRSRSQSIVAGTERVIVVAVADNAVADNAVAILRDAPYSVAIGCGRRCRRGFAGVVVHSTAVFLAWPDPTIAVVTSTSRSSTSSSASASIGGTMRECGCGCG